MKIKKFVSPLSVKAGILALLSLSGCIATTLPYMRAETAQRIAAPAWMVKRDIPADPFLLRAYERIHDRGGVAHLYIEGKGNPSETSDFIPLNPTPQNPLALHLASKDKAENVIYIARPCQYTGLLDGNDHGQKCLKKAWGTHAYTDNVTHAYQTALNEISARYNISGFHLIGHDGGGVIATQLAAIRSDILSVRSVTAPLGNFPDLTTHAAKLSKTPQYHFSGAQDEIADGQSLHAYLQSLPPSSCIQTIMVQEAGHYNGWVNKWPELLTLPVKCGVMDHATTEPIMTPAPPIFIGSDNKVKAKP